MNIQQSKNNSQIIFWTIIGTAIVIVILLSIGSTIYQTHIKQATATQIAIPTLTAEALEAIYQKGLAYINIGHWEEAKRELGRVFEINPNYKEIQAKIVEVEKKIADLEQVPVEMATPTASPISEVTGRVVDLDKGLIAYYPLENNANDTSGTGNDGQFVGQLSFEAGAMGQGLNLEGVDDYVNIGNNPSLTNLTPSGITISAWVYNTQTLTPGSVDLRTVVGQRDQSQDKGYGLQYGYVEGYGVNDYVIWIVFWGGYAGTAHYKIEPGRWYHIAGVFDNNQGQIYVNGEVIDTVTSGSGYRLSTDQVMLGRQGNWSSRYDYHRGRLDEVRIYDRALSATEIKALAQLAND